MPNYGSKNSEQVVICRCENVTWGDIESAMATFEPTSLRQLKLVTRWGMGICQGRMCWPITAAVRLGSELTTGLPVRPPVKPLPMEQLGRTGADDS